MSFLATYYPENYFSHIVIAKPSPISMESEQKAIYDGMDGAAISATTIPSLRDQHEVLFGAERYRT